MDEPPVIRCLRSQRAAALRLLHAANAAGQQEGLAEAIAATTASGDEAWDGLIVAGGDVPAAALWLQLVPGNTALLWPPPPNSPELDSLFRAAAVFVDERGIAVAQMGVGPNEGFSPQHLTACGFPKLADLLYLYCELPADSGSTQSAVVFQPFAEREPQRLAHLVERTYEGTQDCPALDGVRSIDDVLAGYCAQGRHMPEHWYAVARRGGDEPRGDQAVGVLILAEHAPAGNWELVYMGVVPEARGQRLGDALVQFAQNAATAGGAERLVLAVDAANQPALAMYRRTGFSEWERRVVFARCAPPLSVK